MINRNEPSDGDGRGSSVGRGVAGSDGPPVGRSVVAAVGDVRGGVEPMLVAVAVGGAAVPVGLAVPIGVDCDEATGV